MVDTVLVNVAKFERIVGIKFSLTAVESDWSYNNRASGEP